MKPKILESKRVGVSVGDYTGTESTTISLTQNHISIPMVSFALEPGSLVARPGEPGEGLYRTMGRITSVSTTSVTIEFSSPFSGYLHLHAVSEL